jgi:hypothetical protein
MAVNSIAHKKLITNTKTMNITLPSKRNFDKTHHSPDQHFAEYIRRCVEAEKDLIDVVSMLMYLKSNYAILMDYKDIRAVNDRLSRFTDVSKNENQQT